VTLASWLFPMRDFFLSYRPSSYSQRLLANDALHLLFFLVGERIAFLLVRKDRGGFGLWSRQGDKRFAFKLPTDDFPVVASL
jgi:hypothetical protein